MRLRRQRFACLLLLVVHVGACTRWEPTTLSPRALIGEQQPSAVRVTRADGTRVELEDPQIRADSISISLAECDRVFTSDGRAECRGVPAVALGDVQTLDVRRIDPLKTVGAIALVPVVLFGLLAGICSLKNTCGVGAAG